MLKAPPCYGLAGINMFLTQPTSKFDASRCSSSWSVEEAETATLRVGTTPGPFPLNPSRGHCSTHRHQILAVGRHWLPTDASTKSSANLQLLAVQPVRGQSQNRQYLVEIVLLVHLSSAAPNHLTASVLSKTSAQPASPLLS